MTMRQPAGQIVQVDNMRRLVALAQTQAGAEQLIAAAREVVAAWHDTRTPPPRGETFGRLKDSIDRLEELVGRP